MKQVMTREEALKLIPEGWVECNDRECAAASSAGMPRETRYYDDFHYICAIPKPKPAPRRVEVGGEILFDKLGELEYTPDMDELLRAELKLRLPENISVTYTHWKVTAVIEEVLDES